MGPKYAVKKDGRCWGISGTWWILSGVLQKHLRLEVEQDVLEPEPACDTVHCYVRKGVDLGFETLGIFLKNPISSWTAGMKFLTTGVIAKFRLMWKIPGILLIIMLLNMMAFIYMRVADVFVRIWKLFNRICRWPLFSLILGTIKCIYNFCVSIPRKAEEEGVKKAKKEANAVWKSSSRLFKEISDKLAEAEKGVVFDSQAKEIEG